MAFDTNNLYVGDLKQISNDPRSKTENIIKNVLLYKISDGMYIDFSMKELNEEDFDKILKSINNHDEEINLDSDFVIFEYGKGPDSYMIENLQRLNIKPMFVSYKKLMEIYLKFSSTPIDQEIEII